MPCWIVRIFWDCWDQPAGNCFILGDKQENLKSYPNYSELLSMVVTGRPIWRLINVYNIIPGFYQFTPDQSVPVVMWNAIRPAGLSLPHYLDPRFQRRSKLAPKISLFFKIHIDCNDYWELKPMKYHLSGSKSCDIAGKQRHQYPDDDYWSKASFSKRKKTSGMSAPYPNSNTVSPLTLYYCASGHFKIFVPFVQKKKMKSGTFSLPSSAGDIVSLSSINDDRNLPTEFAALFMTII